MTIADRVKKLRTAARMTQAQFAKRLLISRDYLSQIEGGRPPSARLAMQIDLVEQLGLDAIGARPGADKVGSGLNLREGVVPFGEREGCEAHVKAYLNAAEKIPNGLIIARHNITRKLPLSDFEPVDDFPKPEKRPGDPGGVKGTTFAIAAAPPTPQPGQELSARIPGIRGARGSSRRGNARSERSGV